MCVDYTEITKMGATYCHSENSAYCCLYIYVSVQTHIVDVRAAKSGVRVGQS